MKLRLGKGMQVSERVGVGMKDCMCVQKHSRSHRCGKAGQTMSDWSAVVEALPEKERLVTSCWLQYTWPISSWATLQCSYKDMIYQNPILPLAVI